MNEILPSPLSEPVWFVLFFAVFWAAILMLISLWSGWWGLSREFRATRTPEGDSFWFASGSLGNWLLASYSNCLFLNVGREGIRLAVMFPFRPFHPPLFIPSAAIESAVEKRFLFFFRYTRIHIRDHWPILTIHGRAGRRILELYGRPALQSAGMSRSAAVVR